MKELLYLTFFHGRRSPLEELDDWGFEGPILGPFSWFHTTYRHHVKLGVMDEWLCDLEFVEDLAYYDGCYYGDFSVSCLSEEELQRQAHRVQEPCFNKFSHNLRADHSGAPPEQRTRLEMP